MALLTKLKPAAEALGTSEYWLRSAAKAGLIPACKPSGKWLVDVEGTRAVLLASSKGANDVSRAFDQVGR